MIDKRTGNEVSTPYELKQAIKGAIDNLNDLLAMAAVQGIDAEVRTRDMRIIGVCKSMLRFDLERFVRVTEITEESEK